jgi:formiminotetrahydrofolate cyclodeaminase
MMSEIIHKSIQVYLDELASKSATPGGGSAAALMGAQSAALTGMVCNLTIGKPRFAAVEVEMQQLLENCENLRKTMCALIQADIDVFNRVMAGYALPKETDTEKSFRSEAIQAVLKEATDVPLACAHACFQAMELSIKAADIGNPNVLTDAGAALMSAYSGVKTAALNVYVNAGSLKDRVFAESRLHELEQILETADAIVESSYKSIAQKI